MSGAVKVAVNPWVIAIVVALAAFMEVLDTTIANVALRYVAGGLGVSEDQASWVVTTYLVANAIIVTATGWFAQKFGRKRFFLACLGLFTLSSIACGLSWNLNMLLFFRILQGFAGGGMVPVAQSILADAFPPNKRGQAFALFGVAVVVAPVIGPTLGGWIADNIDWHWCFLINGPVGLATMGAIYVLIEETERSTTKVSFDGVGFALIGLFLGALELVLDRGTTDDWFGSSIIREAAAVSALAFLLMIPWELSRKNPLIDLHMVVSRQFGSCFIVMGATGAILLATTNFLPQLTQDDFGYTATWAGLALSPGGLVSVVAMFAVGQLSRFVQPKYLIATGAAICALSMYWLTSVDSNTDFWFFAKTRMLIGAGLPLVFIPIIAASYEGLKKSQTDMASALLNAARNTGGSMGVSLATNVLAHREQFHQNHLAEAAIPSSVPYQQAMQQATNFFHSAGSTSVVAKQQAFAWVGQQVTQQASLLAYIDVFWTLMLVSAAAIPLALMLRKVKLGAAAPAGH